MALPIELRVLNALADRFRSPASKTFRNIARKGPASGPAYFEARDRVLPEDYNDPLTFAKDHLLANLLKKWERWEGFDPKQAALRSWIAAEQRCAVAARPFTGDVPIDVLKLVHVVQGLIWDVIGSGPDFRAVHQNCRFGSGATYDVKRRDAQVHHKLDKLSTTPACLKHAWLLTDDLPVDRYSQPPVRSDGYIDNEYGFVFEIVRGNRGVLVPKSGKTDRPIACEPTLNSFIQQGVGRLLKKLLLTRAGVNLYDQSVNSSMALFANLIQVSTLDLSSASDTLSDDIVRMLLPRRWYDFLSDLRSPVTEWHDGDGKVTSFVLKKFSAMGNAFTFELETLIFWAIAMAVCGQDNRSRISVYGDDIIVPREHGLATQRALELFGFVINREKSFHDGEFHESCGTHSFAGVDVTPPHHSDGDHDGLGRLIMLHNRLYRWGAAHAMDLVRDSLNLIKREAHSLGVRVLPQVPYGFNDAFGFWTEALLTNKNGDYRCLTYEPTPKRRKVPDEDHCYLYFYWQRTGLSPHSDDLGHQGWDVAGSGRLRWRRVWASSVQGT